MENKRFAIETGVTLSGNLISACLAMLAIVAALFTFIIEKRTTTLVFYLLIGLSFAFFITSIVFGGKGINAARRKAFAGVLDMDCSKNQFNWQAMSCLAGVFLFTVSIFFTSTKKEENIELKEISKTMNKFLELQTNQNMQIKQLQNKVNVLEENVKKLQCKKETSPNSG